MEYRPPTIAPILFPITISIGIPNSSITSKTGIIPKPLAPPPPKTKATEGLVFVCWEFSV